MREVTLTYYIANDGKKFEHEYECEHYENQQEYTKLIENKELILVCENGTIHLKDEDYEEATNDFAAIYAKSDRAMEFLDKLAFPEFEKNRRYFWNSDAGVWSDLDDYLETLLYYRHLLGDED